MNAIPTTPPHTLEHRGCCLAYRLTGQGPPVIFIQGVGVHGDGWTPQTSALSDSFHCLSFDNRGMGLSQPLGTELSLEQMADDARALMDANGWDSAHVVGHSMGGLIAQVLALSARGRVRSLALLCTIARGKSAAPLTPMMFWLGLKTRIGTKRSRRRAFLRLVMPPSALAGIDTDALAAELAPYFGHDLAESPPVAMKQLAALRKCDATPRLGELAGVPTLVVSATHDPIAPPALGRALATGIPGARYVELADASHGVPVHQPERINVLLREHLAAAEGATRLTGG